MRHYRFVKTDGPDDLVPVPPGRQADERPKHPTTAHPARRTPAEIARHLAMPAQFSRNVADPAGTDPKSVQAQMRHSRIETTLGIYAQVVPETRRQSFRKLSRFAKKAVLKAGPKPVPLRIQ